jgi:hypothetical protein
LNLVIFGAAPPVYIFLLPSVPRRQDTSTIKKVKSRVLSVGGATMYTVERDTSNTAFAGYTVLLGLGMTCSHASCAVSNDQGGCGE